MVLERSIEQAQGDDVLTKLDAINRTLGSVVETIRPPEKSVFPIGTTRQASHIRFRGYELVIMAVGADNDIVLHIGNTTFTFYADFVTPVAGNARYFNKVVPFPVLVDRGTDVWFDGTDVVTSWLTYTPE